MCTTAVSLTATACRTICTSIEVVVKGIYIAPWHCCAGVRSTAENRSSKISTDNPRQLLASVSDAVGWQYAVVLQVLQVAGQDVVA